VDAGSLQRVFFSFLFFSVIWGLIWFGLKNLLLKHTVGFTKEERRAAFSSRMDRPFDVADLVARYSERKIRVVDMIGRRGRFITLQFSVLLSLYWNIAEGRSKSFATGFLGDSLADAVILNWVGLALFYPNNIISRAFWGAQSRVMDGELARANCLLITTLWSVFKFVMVPIGSQLQGLFPPEQFAPLFILIWGCYTAADGASEIFGSLFGRQTIRVRGVGDVNRKSVVGTLAGFACALALAVWVVQAHQLPAPWLGLAFVVSLSSSFVELYSPRGTDDFTIATTNALWCWAFGAWVL
jgi:dolichol kinase